MRVEPFSGSPPEWDRFVRSTPARTAFHLYGWRRVIEETFGHDCPYLCAREEAGESAAKEGALAGVLPLVRVKSRLFGDYLVSMPFLNYGGPLGSEEARTALARAAAERAREEGVDLLELRSREPLSTDLEVSHRKITVALDLPGEPGALWDALPSKVRSQVRRPRKAGVEVRFGHAEAGPFYEVFSRHMRDLGTPVMPSLWFEALPEVFGDEVWFGCAYLDGAPIAAGAGFRWREEFEMTWAAALREHSRIAANMLLYWSFMERAIEEGLAVFNFGRCTPGSGTHRFKSQWGGRDERLWWYRLSPGGVEKTPSPEDDAYRWGPRLWRRLPLPLANLLGPRVVRFIP